MNASIDHANLHRTAKYFMDNGRAATARDAVRILEGFSLSVRVSDAHAQTREGQIALLTLVNLARRTMLGGVEVIGLPDVPTLVSLTNATTLREAVRELGGKCRSRAKKAWPTALIGDAAHRPNGAPAWRLSWDGWRGGVIPCRGGADSVSGPAIALAPAMAAAICAAEVFAFHAGDHPMAGKRAAGISLWRPDADWLSPDGTEPELSFLPCRLWLIGLGNLGQAYAWLLACLPYPHPAQVELMLQDFDRMAVSNDSTSMLATMSAVDCKKTRWVSSWLERRGFSTAIEERQFGNWSRRSAEEPGVALCGVDNAEARAALESAGFDLVIEAGLGAGPESFRSFSMHSFPASRSAASLWTRDTGPAAADVTALPAYRDLAKEGLDECGLVQIASRTVGVPFVGLLAGGLVIGELLRRLHGAVAFELVSGSLSNLADAEVVPGRSNVYAHGHVSTEERRDSLQ